MKKLFAVLMLISALFFLSCDKEKEIPDFEDDEDLNYFDKRNY